jgi:hypothetical protein
MREEGFTSPAGEENEEVDEGPFSHYISLN